MTVTDASNMVREAINAAVGPLSREDYRAVLEDIADEIDAGLEAMKHDEEPVSDPEDN